jgi:glycosyltransferase involved in cell wall biosynthesis
MRSGGYCRAGSDAVGETPLVTVIIPTRDRPALVAGAVRSAIRQTHDHLEVVVVDDGSTTPLAFPLDLAGDPRVRTLRLDTPVGAGEARNVAARVSQGALLAFLDDDDEWRPAKIERQVQTLARCGEGVAVVETGYDLWDGQRLVQRYLPQPNRDLRTALLAQPHLQPSTVLMRKSAFEALGGFDPSLTRGEDWELWVRFADSYEAAVLPEVQVDRRVSEARAGEILVWHREIVRRLEPRIDALPPSERSRVRAVHLLAESHLLALLGEAKAARAKALLALRERPSGWRRPALYVVRSFIGERAWSAGKAAFRVTAHPVLRALGRDPFLRG